MGCGRNDGGDLMRTLEEELNAIEQLARTGNLARVPLTVTQTIVRLVEALRHERAERNANIRTACALAFWFATVPEIEDAVARSVACADARRLADLTGQSLPTAVSEPSRIYRAEFLWGHEDGSIEAAGYEFANAGTEDYSKEWWDVLLERVRQATKGKR